MPTVPVNPKEIYAPRKYFIELADFNGPTFKQLIETFNVESNEDGQYPIFKIMALLNGLRKKRGKTLDIPSDKGDDSLSIKQELEYEKLQEVRIKNRERLGRLIPVEVVKSRIRDDYSAVANAIRYGAKLAAVKLSICSNARDCENIMIDTWNKALEYLKESSKNVRWEEEGSQVKLGRTGVAESSEESSSGNGN